MHSPITVPSDVVQQMTSLNPNPGKPWIRLGPRKSEVEKVTADPSPYRPQVIGMDEMMATAGMNGKVHVWGWTPTWFTNPWGDPANYTEYPVTHSFFPYDIGIDQVVSLTTSDSFFGGVRKDGTAFLAGDIWTDLPGDDNWSSEYAIHFEDWGWSHIPLLEDMGITVTDMELGYGTFVFRKPEGNWIACGNNQWGMAGVGPLDLPNWGEDWLNELYAMQIPDNVIKIQLAPTNGSAGLGLTDDGKLWGWGYNGQGLMMENPNTAAQGDSFRTPVELPIDDVVDIDIGLYNAVAKKSDGSLWAWGQNNWGQFGLGDWLGAFQSAGISFTPPIYYEPVKIFDNADEFSVGHTHIVIKGTDGKLYSAGNSANWQTPQGSTFYNKSMEDYRLGMVPEVSTVTRSNGVTYHFASNWEFTEADAPPGEISSLHTSWDTSAAILDGCEVCSFGPNDRGKRGNGQGWLGDSPLEDTEGQHRFQWNVADFTVVKGGVKTTNFFGVTHANSEGDHSVVSVEDAVYGWGFNTLGQAGVPESIHQPAATYAQNFQGYASIACGMEHTLLLANDGTVWAVGDNSFGQLGDGTLQSSDYPIQVYGLNNVVEIAAGDYHNVARTSDGSIYTWGSDNEKQLGRGFFMATDEYSPPDDEDLVPNKAYIVGVHPDTGNAQDYDQGFLENATQVWAGRTSTMVRDANGEVWGTGYPWIGKNETDELAISEQDGFMGLVRDHTYMSGTDDHFTKFYNNPLSLKKVAAGLEHIMWLFNDGELWISTVNFEGTAGNGTTNTSSPEDGEYAIPVQVTGTFNDIDAGPYACYAVDTSGLLYAWGSNEFGQLGQGDTQSSPSPLQITELSGVTQVKAGRRHVVAVLGDGTAWGWGANSTYQVGDGTQIDRHSPVQVLAFNGYEKFDLCEPADEGEGGEPGPGEPGGPPLPEYNNPDPDTPEPNMPEAPSFPLPPVNPQVPPVDPSIPNPCLGPPLDPTGVGLETGPNMPPTPIVEMPPMDPLDPAVPPMLPGMPIDVGIGDIPIFNGNIDDITFPDFPPFPCNFSPPDFGDICNPGPGGGNPYTPQPIPGFPPGPIIGGTPTYPTDDIFTSERCYTNRRVVDVLKELCQEMGLDPTQMILNEDCDKTFTKCFAKGSRKFDAIWYLQRLCGYGWFDPGTDPPEVDLPEPLDTTWVFHEYQNLVEFNRKYDAIEVYYAVEVYRPQSSQMGRVTVPSFVHVEFVNPPYQVSPDKVLQIQAAPTWTDQQCIDRAKEEAAKMKTGLRITAAIPLNLSMRYRHQLIVVKPSRDYSQRFMVMRVTHQINQGGHLTLVEAIALEALTTQSSWTGGIPSSADGQPIITADSAPLQINPTRAEKNSMVTAGLEPSVGLASLGSPEHNSFVSASVE